MPKPPKPKETKSEFMNRCIPFVYRELDEKENKREQAYAVCQSMWRQSKRERNE